MMKKKMKKIAIPILLSILCGFISGRLMFGIYEDKGKKILTSSVIYLIEDASYDNLDTMKASSLSSNYVYYEDNGKYNTVIGMTKNKDNIDKIKKAYDKDLVVSEYLLNNNDINNKISEIDEKMKKTDNVEDIRDLSLEIINIYKDNEDIKMTKIS